MSPIKSTFRKHRIPIRTKINMDISVLLYGSEAWSTTLADRQRLDVFDMRCQRRLLHVFWQQHISNGSIRERTKQPTASSLLRQRCLCWFGHLHRMPSSLPDEESMTSTQTFTAGKDQEVAPTLDGLIPSSLTLILKHDHNSAGLDTTNAARMVFDRPQWKAFVSGLPTLESEQGSLVK